MLTSKPLVYVCNVEEESAAIGNALSKEVETYAKADGSGCVIVSAAIEAEISQLTYQEEKNEFLTTLGLEEAGLNKLIRAGYGLLNLITFSRLVPKRLVRGHFQRTQPLLKEPARFIRISSEVSLERRLLATKIILRVVVKMVLKKQVN